MLNPSTADGQEDDATIRRCVNFASGWGFGGIEVVNLFALRLTRPVHLTEHDDPVGPLNWLFKAEAIHYNESIIGGWGSSGDYAERYMQKGNLVALVRAEKKRVLCLGMTKAGDPRHPLYVKGDTRLEVYR